MATGNRASDLKYRYPGLRPFRADDKDVFYGRDTEARELTDLIRAEQTVILFSKSGLGKSSLLNARVCPQLVSNGFWPILIRFQPQTADAESETSFNPVDVIVDRLRAEFDTVYQNLDRQVNGWRDDLKTHPEPNEPISETAEATPKPQPDDDKRTRLLSAIQTGEQNLAKAVRDGDKFVPAQPILFNAESPRLWEYVKIHQFPNNAVPIFVFDQFEEFFTFPLGSQQVFAQQLAELIHDQPPTRIVNWLLDIPPFQRQPNTMAWGKQLLVKCLLSIRSDRLFEIDSLKPYIPLIFRNRYKLNPLHDEQAREAIDKPAQTEGNYRTPRFQFEPAVREKIIRELSNKDCEIESSQLQIVCNHFENYVVENYSENKPTGDELIVIDKIDNSHSIKRILRKFYRTQLRSIGSPDEIELARQVLENELVVNHQRVGLAQFRMNELLKGHTDIIEKLEEARLIRPEETHLGKTYELSHDTLIEPVENVRQLVSLIRQREVREKERIREREIQLERQEKARIEREQLLKERREKNEQLVDEKRQRRRLKQYLFWLIVFGSTTVILITVVLHKSIKSKTQLANANSDWASDEHKAGNQRMAYRLWESNDGLMPFWYWENSHYLLDGLQSRLMAPFSGIRLQTNAADTSLPYVASLYQGNYFEVWAKSLDSTTQDTTYQKLDWLDSLNLKSATDLQLRANFLTIFTSDSALRVLNLTNQKPVFPRTGSYYLPSLQTLLRKGLVTRGANGAVRPVRTTLLPPKGRWLAALDTTGYAHLFDLEKKGDEHKSVQKSQRSTAAYSLDSMAFSASEDFLLAKHPGRNQYDLFDLRTEQPPISFANTVFAGFSPSGKYITTLSKTGQLVVRELLTKQVRYSGSVWQPVGNAQLAELVFNRDESALVVVIKRSIAGQPGTSLRYDLFRVDLARLGPPSVIAQHVRAYWPFGWAGHVLFTPEAPGLSVNYTLATGDKQPFRLPEELPIAVGKTAMLFARSSSPGLSRKVLSVYDVRNGQQTKISPVEAGQKQRFAFYAPPEGPDEKLIQATPHTLTIFDLTHTGRPGMCVYPDQCLKTALFIPNTLRVSGPLIQVMNGDGVRLSFFADTQKNKLDYLNRHIYPKLSQKDLTDAGL